MSDREPSMPYEDMKRTLIRACDSYYNKSFSEMSDKDFDALKDEFRYHWPDDPFLKTIGAPPPEVSEWEKTKHAIPMYSCNKVNTPDELEEWATGNGGADAELMTSEKLDGISIDIPYMEGNITHAITRGDGEIGENILSNAVRFQGVKQTLPIKYSGSVRGEVMMKKSDLKAVNLICEERGIHPYQNVRNAASGIARNQDGTFSEYLFVQFYYASGDFKTKKEMFEFIENTLGLPTSRHFHGNLETAKVVYNEYEQSIRASLDHEIDGLVVEFDNLALQEQLGMKNENLRGQIAFKFTSEKVQTKVVGVDWQLGTQGRLTPVLHMEAVALAGVTVRKASVHNLQIFYEFNFHEGDTILVERANDVIPQVVKNLSNHPGQERGQKLTVPTECPVCGSRPEFTDKFLMCVNPDCAGGKLGSLIKWVKKLDLKGIGGSTLERLYNSGYVQTPADLYKLRPEMICEMEGFGRSSANKIIDTLNAKKELTLVEFIGGLNMVGFGRGTAKKLIKGGYDTVDKIINAGIAQIAEVGGIGVVTAQSIHSGLKKKADVIEQLFANGITIKEAVKMGSKGSTHPLSGKSVVFTGKLSLVRKEAQAMVESVGGSCPSSISQDTDYLVIADPTSTSSKAQKARKWGINLIGEAEFLAMMGK